MSETYAGNAKEVDGNVKGNALHSSCTATKHNTWSERLLGLANELHSYTRKTEEYVLDQTSPESPAMRALRQFHESADWQKLHAEGKTMWLYGPEFSTDLTEAMYLKMMAASSKAKRILEVGMFMGYGTVAMAEGAGPGSEVIALEIDGWLKTTVESIIKGHECAKSINIIEGSAIDTIKTLTGQFDLIFIDANKIQYQQYYDDIMNNNLLADDGLLLIDNTLYLGYPCIGSQYEVQKSRVHSAAAIQQFNEYVKNDPRVWQIMLPIRDGVTMVRKNKIGRGYL